ncbi:MAG: hypothetical protein E6Q57_14815 [Mycobacterium sp.]|nr:MAG: hypothetical protein E6Q57_14815 [Mycobacterium sp.]
MRDQYALVSGMVYHGDGLNLREEVWSFAMGQREWGPRKLVVAFCDRDGALLSLAHTDRTDPPEAALEACIRHVGLNAAAAVAYCDEVIRWGPPTDEVLARFALAREIAADWGIHLLDWIACDDQWFRSAKWASSENEGPWWDLPS